MAYSALVNTPFYFSKLPLFCKLRICDAILKFKQLWVTHKSLYCQCDNIGTVFGHLLCY